MISKTPAHVHSCLCLGGGYTLEEVDGVCRMSTPLTVYTFQNGMGLSSSEQDGLTQEILEKVEKHLQRTKWTTFKVSFRQALSAIGYIKNPTAEFTQSLREAFSRPSVMVGVIGIGVSIFGITALCGGRGSALSRTTQGAIVASTTQTIHTQGVAVWRDEDSGEDRGEDSDEDSGEDGGEDGGNKGDEDGGSHCTKNPKDPGCGANPDGDVGKRKSIIYFYS